MHKVKIYCGEYFHAVFTNESTMIPCDPNKAQMTLTSLGFELKRCFKNASDRKVEIWEKKGGKNEKINGIDTNG